MLLFLSGNFYFCTYGLKNSFQKCKPEKGLIDSLSVLKNKRNSLIVRQQIKMNQLGYEL
jgi:hypothetical protein